MISSSIQKPRTLRVLVKIIFFGKDDSEAPQLETTNLEEGDRLRSGNLITGMRPMAHHY